jgi:hypothetical protein
LIVCIGLEHVRCAVSEDARVGTLGTDVSVPSAKTAYKKGDKGHPHATPLSTVGEEEWQSPRDIRAERR